MMSVRRHIAGLAMAVIGVTFLPSCSHSPSRSQARLEAANARVKAARLEDDPAVAARLDEMRAALSREPAPILDEFQIRVDNAHDGDHDVEVTARVPVPNPFEFRAERSVRRRATGITEARMDETILERRAELCFRNVEGQDGLQRAELYAVYEAQQLDLLDWNRRTRESGALNEQMATRFEIERRVRLAKRIPPPPAPAMPPNEEGLGLPVVGTAPETKLVRNPEHIRTIVRRVHPSVAVQKAEAERYAAMSRRAWSRDLPWLDFVDVSYEARQGRTDQIAGQIAVRVPLGSTGRAEKRRFTALRDSKKRDSDRVTRDHARRARLALDEIDQFESNTARWRLLLDLAEQASATAESWKRDRRGSPSQVAGLFDDVYEARTTVLSARTRAGLAACSLLSSTGVAAADWRREPVPGLPLAD